MDQHQGRSSSRSTPVASGTESEWKSPDFWKGIVTEGDGEQLAVEAQAFLQTYETNLPKEMRPGFETLENVLLDVCRNAPAEAIRQSEKSLTGIGATA